MWWPLLDEDYEIILLRCTMHNFASAPCKTEWLLNYCAFVTARAVADPG
jgi:5'(3')-deoxyribonucleotidase